MTADPTDPFTYTPAESLSAHDIHVRVTSAVDRARTLVDDPAAPSQAIGRLNRSVTELCDALEALLAGVVRS